MMDELATYSPSSANRQISKRDGEGRREIRRGELTDCDSPDVDEDEKTQVRKLLKRENKGKDMIGYTLSETIQRVERMAGVRGWHDPFVMRLVKPFIEGWVMETPVDPVNETIGKGDEKRELQDVVEPERGLRRCVVELCVAANLAQEEGDGENGHYGESNQRLSDLEANLVPEVFGMRESGMVKDEVVRKRGADEVDQKAEEPREESVAPDGKARRELEAPVPCYQIETQSLPAGIVPGPRTHVGKVGRIQLEELAGGMVGRGRLAHA